MSNPHNRRRTRGAFGKPKTPAKGFPLRRSAAPDSVPSPKNDGFNISNALIEFARPITEQAGNNHTAIRGAMNVAILLWNALIEGGPNLEAARKKLLALPGATPAQIEELIATMSARKEELYPSAKQLICNYDLNFTKKGANIRIASVNLNPEGVEKTNIAEQLGVPPAPASPIPPGPPLSQP